MKAVREVATLTQSTKGGGRHRLYSIFEFASIYHTRWVDLTHYRKEKQSLL